jgi:hypothetical protein
MECYRNQSGNSGVSEYELREKSILVVFGDGGTYLYDYASAGMLNVEHMKALARSGRGLATFITRHVRKKYAAKSK